MCAGLLIDPEAVARFASAVTRLTDGDKERIGKDRIGLAISGGPDSIAMLLLAHAAFPGGINAATVDHGLRPEAADEAAFVGSICISLGVPHAILRPAVPIAGNIQSAARTARYALLGQWAQERGCRWIATAHHGDDQLETVLMRLARGSGVAGLAAIRARNGNIIRPLLDFSKVDLEAICARANIIPIRDPSNENEDFDRVAMRKWLAQSGPMFDLPRITRSTTALADAAASLDWMAARMAEQHIMREGDKVTIDAAGLPRDMQRRLLVKALHLLDPDMKPRGDAIDRALRALHNGDVMTLGNILCQGGVIWQLSSAPPRRAG